MTRTLVCTIVVIFFLLLVLSGGDVRAASKGTASKQSCAACHSEFSSLLPKEHPPVTGKDVTACTKCHAPDTKAQAKPKAYSARLHLSHTQPGAEVDCLACHTWKPGKTLGVKGTKASLGVLSKEGMEETKKIFASWSSSKYLDAHHGKKKVTCSGCHEGKVPEQGDSVENARCFACHGDEEKLAKKTEPKDFPDRNPHKSHLGTVNCTVCHSAHKASKIYCLDCHTKFNMKIPFGEGPQAKPAAGGKAK
jgi:hypothetical protein